MSSLGITTSGLHLHDTLETLVADQVASRIGAKDATLWGPEAEPEASKRLGWVDPFDTAHRLIPEITQLRDELRADGITQVVLAGMGGSSLGAEIMAAAQDAPLTVLDSTDPEMVASVLASGIAQTVFVISSKSGSTAETDAARRVFVQALQDAGLDVGKHLVVVTDPGSPLEQQSLQAGYRKVFTADPTIGGRYSALSAFGLVPTGLAGVNLEALIADAEAAALEVFTDDEDNIALRLGAVLGEAREGRNKLILVNRDAGLPGFGDWVEQLIAESTGKEGTGVLPVIVEGQAPELDTLAEDYLVVELVSPQSIDGDDAVTVPERGAQVFGDLGAQLLVWEVATVVAGRLLGINPFDQPNVESAKVATRALLANPPEAETPQLVLEGVAEIFGSETLLSGLTADTDNPVAVLNQLFGLIGDTLVGDRSYIAVQAFVNRLRQTELAELRATLAHRYNRPVTFGWGPRFLHSTGQYHKGGPAEGVFIQITADSTIDLDIPGLEYTFGQLIQAQAAGDGQVLTDTGLPVVRIHLLDREQTTIATLLQAAAGTSGN